MPTKKRRTISQIRQWTDKDAADFVSRCPLVTSKDLKWLIVNAQERLKYLIRLDIPAAYNSDVFLPDSKRRIQNLKLIEKYILHKENQNDEEA